MGLDKLQNKTEEKLKQQLLRYSKEYRKIIKVCTYKIESEKSGDFIDQEMISNKRDLQLKGIFDNDTLGYTLECIRLKIVSNPDFKSKNHYYYNKIIELLSLVTKNDDLKKIVVSYSKFLWYIDTSVEWCEVLLKIHNFRTIPPIKKWENGKYVEKYVDLTNFNTAKINLKNKK